MLALFALIGMAAADDRDKEEQLQENDTAYSNPTTWEERSLKFNLEQNVSGTGFFAVHKYAQMPDDTWTEGRLFNGVEAKTKAHGSGNINPDSIIYLENSYSNKTWINGALDEDEEVINEEEAATSIIQMKEESKMTYSSSVMGIGSRYYNKNPVVFNSLLSEEDWIMNRNGLNSLHHLVDLAHGLNKVLDAQSNAGDYTINTTMNIEEDLIDGRAHFGVLQLQGIPVDEEQEEDSKEVQVLGLAMKAWKKPLLELDEDYVGNFHIKKNMNLTTYAKEKEKEYSWLPCCFGGFNDMNYEDAKVFKSAGGVFDCTCFIVPAKAHIPG